MLAVSIMSAGQNVYAAELPYETPDEIAEEEYWDSLKPATRLWKENGWWQQLF